LAARGAGCRRDLAARGLGRGLACLPWTPEIRMEPSPSCSVVDLADLQRETGRRGGGLVGGKGETGAKRRDTTMERRWTCGSNAGGRAARFAWAASSSLGQRRVGEEIGWSSFVAKQISRNVEVWGSTFGWGVVTRESGQPNIQTKCLARISSTSKQLKLRHSGRECPNIQCQASIQTSKRYLRYFIVTVRLKWKVFQYLTVAYRCLRQVQFLV
jgi:hypothetical protein